MFLATQTASTGREFSPACIMTICVLTFVYNDWPALWALLPLIDSELGNAGLAAEMLIVDDGSTQAAPSCLPVSFRALHVIRVLRLRKNLGHQRAIATGLAYIYDHLSYDAIVLMDGDGEDRPADAVRMVRIVEKDPTAIVFAERSKRSETPLFVFFYQVYRLMHVLLTGTAIRVGNFSVIPSSLLGGLVVDMNLWNHYAACVYVSNAKTSTISTERGKRLDGQSKLHFTSLVIHGLSAISCYNEKISVRLLLCTSFAFTLLLSCLLLTVGIRLFTHLAIPGWATYTAGIVTIILLQLMLLSLLLSMSLLSGRKRQDIIPLRDYGYFLAEVKELYRV
ncbi:MAG TPA: glycosyltransferase [Bryobacteraceae bacterium]|nr:glycosyltransferase [Bryobacteraceae bacterium]